ncbi:hypothetical protein Gbro_4706 [Gordonia bronchialis DSM 43247]|uniref:Uncharacterized protein n=1 Tax=Gordonia bronchialis (strain ATCC 25592 / DSM 43247 / BCRC 13721 / JCM 3198 / KCTC 3076 / NBRC 16047 / NCTC 10667) TaxID=526226 RepID=D0L879_GORB4|nr:hypothetical protein Gbro_4706 [Gordonia bronchialis DSM 43247]STQ66850.1 Uncharacterised protein [Gordonia bronchialis]
MPVHAWLRHVLALLRLDRTLTTALTPGRRAAIGSLHRAHVAGVTLSGMDLWECALTSVDGLDELVIAGDSGLTSNRGARDETRTWHAHGRTWWRVDRRVIRDELTVRATSPTPYARTEEPANSSSVTRSADTVASHRLGHLPVPTQSA